MAVIEVENLQRSYYTTSGMFGRSSKTVEALKGINFQVNSSEIFGLLGPNGAGKTTAIKILSTMLTPTSGTAKVLGKDVVTQAKEIRNRINVIFGGERGLYWRLTARDNLQYFADLYNVPRHVQRSRLPELLAMVGLADRADDRVETYSKGMKQRLHIARGLVNDPDILFMDEPTIGLDPVAGQELRDLVLRLKGAGKTVILTTHYMFEADQVCDRIAVIDHGGLVALDTPKNLKRFAVGLCVLEAVLTGVSPQDVERLRTTPGITAVNVRVVDQKHILQVQSEDPVSCRENVVRILGERHLIDLREREASLEDAYLKLVGGQS